MKVLRRIRALVTVGLLSAPLLAQDLGAELQRAIQREAATGDRAVAIAAYDDIVKRAGSDAALAARALLQSAKAHEKLNDGQARTIYERIARDFSGQTAAAAEARNRLGS